MKYLAAALLLSIIGCATTDWKMELAGDEGARKAVRRCTLVGVRVDFQEGRGVTDVRVGGCLASARWHRGAP